MSSRGKLNLVSVGPGAAELIPPLAQSALCASEVIVGYELYLTWIKPWIDGKAVYAFALTQERERASVAIRHARNGHAVSLVSSGDVGVYGMAAVVLEEMAEDDTFELSVVPGISAATSCASLLGSPLSHDFATLSLSDLLCPWDRIEYRARQLAQADLVVALYNVQSKTRQEGVYRILRLFLEEKGATTWCGVVRNAYRPGQEAYICTLGELLEHRFDMLTTIIVGNRFTQRKGDFIFTPRDSVTRALPPSGEPDERGGHESHQPVWVFSGTSDGNALAAKLSETGYYIIVSAATEYGREIACENLPGITIRSGRMGVEARRRQLVNSGARAIVDATHPFATTISYQLMQLAEKIGIPYVRYERPLARSSNAAVFCKTMEDAAAESVAKGGRVFLASGAKDLPVFLKHEKASRCEWFVRLTPEPDSLQRALDLGVPRANICAMQGPFSQEFDEVLWKSWRIDCVVTKESGEAGGFLAKAEAAYSLGIRLIVVERPQVDYPFVAYDFDAVVDRLKRLLCSGSSRARARSSGSPLRNVEHEDEHEHEHEDEHD
jgi:cobalt-factor III methyltransferase